MMLPMNLSRKKDRAKHMVINPRAKYKLKWNVPLNDVEVVEYGPGVNVLTSSYRTTISHSKEGMQKLEFLWNTVPLCNVWCRISRNFVVVLICCTGYNCSV